MILWPTSSACGTRRLTLAPHISRATVRLIAAARGSISKTIVAVSTSTARIFAAISKWAEIGVRNRELCIRLAERCAIAEVGHATFDKMG